MDASDTRARGVLRYDVLMWAGIAGSALSLFLKLDGVIAMSPWATVLVGHWAYVTQGVTDALATLMGLGRGLIPREFAVLLAFTASVLATVIGVRLKALALAHERAKGGLRLANAFLLVPVVVLAIGLSIGSLWVASRTFSALAPLPEVVRGKPGLVLAFLVMAFVSSAPIALFAKDRADALAFAAIFAPVPVILAHIPVLMVGNRNTGFGHLGDGSYAWNRHRGRSGAGGALPCAGTCIEPPLRLRSGWCLAARSV